MVHYIRHNEIRDLFANLMKKVVHDVEIEPHLQPFDNEAFTNFYCKMRPDLASLPKKSGIVVLSAPFVM